MANPDDVFVVQFAGRHRFDHPPFNYEVVEYPAKGPARLVCVCTHDDAQRIVRSLNQKNGKGDK